MRGFNDDQITAFGRFAREQGVAVRFIEFMPLEEDRVWSPEIVVTLDEILRRMAEFMPLREIGHMRQRDRTALCLRRWHRRDRHHRASVASLLRTLQPRARNLRRQDPHLPVLGARARFGCADAGAAAATNEMADFIRDVVDHKEERHHIGEPGFIPASRTMVHIGG